MDSAVQTAVVTIISYKPLSSLNFAKYTDQYGSYMPSSPLGVYKPLVIGQFFVGRIVHMHAQYIRGSL